MMAFLRIVVAGAVVALGWMVWLRVDDTLGAKAAAEARAQALEAQLVEVQAARAAAESRAAELAMALRHLKVERRRARLTVLEQGPDPSAAGRLLTRVSFQELGADGEPLGPPVEADLPGRMAYIESLVIKFDDALVEAGDPWRGASLCLFRRLFSEHQSPEQGVALDAPGVVPAGYSDADLQPASDLWRDFWELADDPAAAAARGVRALHGEAPFVELRPGRAYVVELRASGGLSVRRDD